MKSFRRIGPSFRVTWISSSCRVRPVKWGSCLTMPRYLTILKYGVIKIRQNGKEELFTVAGGLAEVQPEIVTILADAAENVEDIDITRAQAAKKRAE